MQNVLMTVKLSYQCTYVYVYLTHTYKDINVSIYIHKYVYNQSISEAQTSY